MVIVQAVVDPFEPPVVSRATLIQTAGLAESLLRGEPIRGKIIETILRDKVGEIV